MGRFDVAYSMRMWSFTHTVGQPSTVEVFVAPCVVYGVVLRESEHTLNQLVSRGCQVSSGSYVLDIYLERELCCAEAMAPNMRILVCRLALELLQKQGVKSAAHLSKC